MGKHVILPYLPTEKSNLKDKLKTEEFLTSVQLTKTPWLTIPRVDNASSFLCV